MSQELSSSAAEAFLNAGMRLYPKLGYRKLSVRLLAAEAGLSPGMFHHLFAGKEAFCAAVLQRKYDAGFSGLQVQVKRGRSVRENLRDALRFLAFFVRDHGDWVAQVFADAADDVAPVRDFIRHYAGIRHVALLLELLTRAQRQGALREGTPVQCSAFLMGAVVAPMLIGGRLQDSGLLPAPLAAVFTPQVLDDAAIELRIEWALAAIFREA